jgi:hypothetical protein
MIQFVISHLGVFLAMFWVVLLATCGTILYYGNKYREKLREKLRAADNNVYRNRVWFDFP